MTGPLPCPDCTGTTAHACGCPSGPVLPPPLCGFCAAAPGNAHAIDCPGDALAGMGIAPSPFTHYKVRRP